MATGTSFQMDALQHVNESATQWKTCRCEEGDGEFCLVRKPESHDKQQQASTRCPKCQNLVVVKSGPLFISSKGLGWTSWKKRWFILTRASLVFFRSDPNAPIPRGSEVNLTLGGIELNNSGSVVVRADKKLLTVLFPDGRDGRAFTLKAETSEDMHEWKIALESALSQAPVAALVMGGQNSIFQNDVVDTIENSLEQWKDRRAVKSTVIGRPILLALEDADGNPSFLEKALRFVEQYGVKVEGILRQSADVEEVERRVEEYEQGKNEFSPIEDAHVIGDCIKHILRELPSSPVPASCCTALLEAFRGDRGARISSMRGVILETFPEPNRRLLQRILQMMQIVVSHKSENRMSVSAVAACMAPLLLRPLLAGDCELEDDFDMGGDGSIQLLQAAAAANHAQAIVINLLEQYERIFTDEHLQEDSFSSELYTDSEGSEDDYEYEDEESTDDEIEQDNGYHDVEDDINHDKEDDPERMSSGGHDDSGSDLGSDLYDNKAVDCHDSSYAPSKVSGNSEATERLADVVRHDSQLQHVTRQESSSSEPTVLPQNTALNNGNCLPDETDSCLAIEISDPHESSGEFPTHVNPIVRSVSETISGNIKLIDKPASSIKRTAVWGRTSARKNLSMETIDYISDDEAAVQKLEVTKSDLQSKVTKEVKENEFLQASLERRKEALCNRRLALQQDVERLQLQLQKERALRAYLEAGLINTQPGLPISAAVDSKTRRNLEEIALAESDIMSLKQKVTDLQGQLNQPEQQISESPHESCSQHVYTSHQSNNREMNNAEAYKDDNGQTRQNCDSTQSDRKDEPEEDIIKTAPRPHEKTRSNEFHDSPTCQHKHPPRRKNHNIRSTKTSHDGPTDAGNATIKKTSVRGEDVVSASSSALTRLTNRLNFLKERRVQLVNELQAADTTHSQYSTKGPPPRTNTS